MMNNVQQNTETTYIILPEVEYLKRITNRIPDGQGGK